MARREGWILVGVGLLSMVLAMVMIVCFSPEFKSDPSWAQFIANVTKFGPLEFCRVLSVVTGIVSVYLAARENIWVWPVGIVWCLSTAWVLFVSRYYGDMALMFVYLGLQLHGWWSWTHGAQDRTELPIRWASRRTLVTVLVFAALCYWPTKELLVYVHGKLPWYDALTTVGSLAAQFLLNRKYIENWIGWIIVDAIYVPVYFSTDLPDQALQYLVFLLIAVIGLMNWIRLHRIPSPLGEGKGEGDTI